MTTRTLGRGALLLLLLVSVRVRCLIVRLIIPKLRRSLTVMLMLLVWV